MLAVMALFGVLTVLSACGVVFASKPFNSALYLVLTLFLIAVHFALLGAHFVAAIQVLVYAGAIMVLVIFVIMLLGVDAEVTGERSMGTNVLAATTAGIFVAILFSVISTQVVLPVHPTVDTIPSDGSTKSVGLVLFQDYLFSFEVASVLVLAAIIGAVVLGLEPKRPLPPGRGLKAKRVEQ